MLIAIEGIDGSGKTTVAKLLVSRLRGMGLDARYTYEPFETPFSKALQQLLGRVSPIVEALAMAADRALHVENVIIPWLREGAIVVTDRYVYSSIAYQGARGADIEWVIELNRFAPKPDLGLYLDVDVDTALSRLRGKSGGRWSTFERREVLLRAREIYLELVRRGELIYVDARRSVDEVVNEVVRYVIEKLRGFREFSSSPSASHRSAGGTA